MHDDLRYAWRRLLSAPLFTLAAVTTLALGIGANTAIFSVADAVLFRPLPYADADALHILVWRNRETGARASLIEYPYLQAIDEHHRGLSAVGMSGPGDRLIDAAPDGPEYVAVAGVTANYFDLLGTPAARGRLLTASDQSATGRAAVLSYGFWQTRFGGRDDIVGRPLTIGASTFDIVGVLPRGFVLPSYNRQAAVITVMAPPPAGAAGGTIYPIVRRQHGVTREQAQAELDALIEPLVKGQSSGRHLLYLDDVRALLYPTGRPIMALLLSASALVLLLGCANLANMLLARARQGEREIGIRIALGAKRSRLVRELVCEALLVGVAGAGVALLVTYWSFDLLLQQVPPVAYGRAPVGVDVRVLGFGVALGVLASLIVAVIPAWRATRVDAQHLLQRRSSSGRGTLGRPMVTAQVAMAVLLVFGAAVTARALVTVLRAPLGFSADNVARLSVLPATNLRGAARQEFYVRAIDTLARRGDVVSAGAITSVPLGGSTADEPVATGGARLPGVGLYHVLPGYFEALRIPLRRGRLIDSSDVRSGAGVAVVSEGAAKLLFPDRDPLGASLSNTRDRSFVVIGVVGDARMRFGDDSTQPIYVLPGQGARVMSIMVRLRGRSDAALADLKRELGALAPGTPVGAGWWADEIGSNTAYRNPRFQTLVLGSFAALALVLTATGILGVVSFLVAVRTREMGIRIAVGATPASLVAMMLRRTLAPVAVGLVVGVAATRWAGRLAEAQLFKVDVHDPVMLIAAVCTVLFTAALAAYIPARRAGRVDPIAVLRVD